MSDMKHANGPLLYIQQPTIHKPLAPMQHHYMSSSSSSESSIEPSSTNREKTNKLKSQKASAFIKDNQNDDKKDSSTEPFKLQTQVDKIEKKGKSDRQKFKDMTIREKIDYFTHIPEHIPKMRCEVQTETRNYRGKITDCDEHQNVSVKTGKKSKIAQINIKDITDIKLLGF